MTPPAVVGYLTDSMWALETAADDVVSGTSDNTVLFDTVWDDDNLYVAIRVTDSKVCSVQGTASWQLDSAEIYLDPQNNRRATYDEWDVQMILKYVDIDEVEYGTNTVNFPGAEVRGRETVSGYIIEAAIPWSGLNVDPTVGTMIGFDIGVNDDDGACASRDGELRWAGDENDYQSTAAFGYLLLEELPIDTDTDTDTDTATDTDTNTDSNADAGVPDTAQRR
jgi:hypothetical protein